MKDVTVVISDLKRQLKILAYAFGVLPQNVQFLDPKLAAWMLDMGSEEKRLQVSFEEHVFVANYFPSLPGFPSPVLFAFRNKRYR